MLAGVKAFVISNCVMLLIQPYGYKVKDPNNDYSFIHSFIHSLTHSLIHSFTHSLTHSFMYLYIYLLSSYLYFNFFLSEGCNSWRTSIRSCRYHWSDGIAVSCACSAVGIRELRGDGKQVLRDSCGDAKYGNEDWDKASYCNAAVVVRPYVPKRESAGNLFRISFPPDNVKQAVREAATICPRPRKLTFDLLTLKVVPESRVTWATSVPISVFLGLSVLDLGPMYATDRRQTHTHTHSISSAPITGRPWVHYK